MSCPSVPGTTFPQLQQLSDDVVLNILSFVAEVPFEASEDMGKIAVMTLPFSPFEIVVSIFFS
jgi:hypothetical protein